MNADEIRTGTAICFMVYVKDTSRFLHIHLMNLRVEFYLMFPAFIFMFPDVI